jgi:tryptophan-rich sensory protein
MFFVFIAIPLLAGIAGAGVTAANIHGWYDGLARLPVTPPGWVFAPAWTLLYILMGISLFFFVREGSDRHLCVQGVCLFVLQLILNVLWSFLFFGLHNPVVALAELLVLIAVIAATAWTFHRSSPTAAWLLAPYLAWCCFAACLNAGIVVLN